MNWIQFIWSDRWHYDLGFVSVKIWNTIVFSFSQCELGELINHDLRRSCRREIYCPPQEQGSHRGPCCNKAFLWKMHIFATFKQVLISWTDTVSYVPIRNILEPTFSGVPTPQNRRFLTHKIPHPTKII